jgi:membrane protein YqaA with SNARE-associated domain
MANGLDPANASRAVTAAAAPSTEEVLGAGRLDERPARLYAAGAIGLAGGALLWLAGWLLLRSAGWGTGHWNALWALAGVSFASSVILPIPGVTATLLLALSREPVLGVFGCIGAAAGSVAGAAVLLALGHTGRKALRKHATHSKWSRKTLEWSQKAAKKWTYAGVTVLLVPQFIPKVVVLYAAVLAKLRAVPFLACVFAGVFLRNVLVLGAFTLIP